MDPTKPAIIALSILDCTAEQLASLGLGGYRILATNGSEVVFRQQAGIDVTPPNVRRAIEAANAAPAEPVMKEHHDDGLPVIEFPVDALKSTSP